MYKLTIQTLTGDEKILYYPGNTDYSITAGKLELVVGSAGKLNLIIPMSNPAYDEIARSSIITLYEDGDEIWRGDIRGAQQMFDKSWNVYVLEDLAWLGEEPVAMTEVTNQTRAQRFTATMSAYNSAQSGSSKRQFTQGILTIDSSTIIKWRPEWGKCSTLDCLRTFIAGTDGYVRIRRVTNNGIVTRYVDVVHLSEYGVQASQTIEFGRNLLDFVKDIDITNFVNALYPYGAETGVTLYGETMQRLVGTPIQNDESIAGFGRRARIVTFETENLSTLNRLAEAYLTRYSQPKMKIEAKAVDLGKIEEVNRFNIGDSVRIVAHAFGVDQRDYITKQEIDLLDIANNKIELSDNVQTSSNLTSMVASLAADLESEPSEASILNVAKRNAMELLNGSNGGNIYFKFNDDGQIVEQGFTNNADLDQATAITRWNINGKAIMTRQHPSDPWTIKVAETIDGGIVADFINTGTLDAENVRVINLSASEIVTGIFTVGGSDAGNPLILVKDSSDNAVVTLDQNGITAHAGVIRTADNTFYVDMATSSVRIGAGTNVYDPNSKYSGTYVPANNNYPASSWTDAEKANHIGETFTNTSTKKTYIYKVTPAAIPESNHPYGTNEDAYYRFDCPSGWSVAFLTFDSQCETEGGNYDYLDFYFMGYDGMYKSRLQSTSFAGKTYTISLSQSHSFYLHWHSDSSVNKWGWKFTVSDSGSGTDLPDAQYESLPSASWTLINLASGGTYEWVESTITGYIDAKSGETSLTQEEVYNALTNNGQDQGLYLSGGKIYLNAQYMTSNAITIGGSQYSQKTYLQIRDSSNNEIGRWDKDGIVANAGRFGKLHVLQSDGNTFLKYVTASGRIYIDKSWAQGQLKSYSLITEYRLNPYKEGWLEDGYINVAFNMPVSRTSYQTEVQCVVRIYKHTYGNMHLERTVQLLYNGTVKSSSGSSGSGDGNVVIDEDGNVVENLLGYTFDHTFGANSDEWYQLKFQVTKRSSSYANGTTTLVVDDNKNGSGFILRETSDHKATCTGKFDGEISGQGTFDSVSVGDYISCESGDIVTSTNSYGSIMSYDGIRVWSGAADFGDSNNKMQIFHDDICKESGGTDYYAQFSTSDERVKENIEDLNLELSIKLIEGTRPREFTFTGSEGRHYGVIAQEARKLLDSLGEDDSQLEYIAGKPDGKVPNQRNINYNEYIPHLINYVKKLRSEIDTLKEEMKNVDTH